MYLNTFWIKCSDLLAELKIIVHVVLNANNVIFRFINIFKVNINSYLVIINVHHEAC